LTEDEVETSLTLLQKLVNIPSNKATYENLNKLRDVINTLTYGSEKNTVYRKPKDNTDKIKYRDSSAFM
jgi:excinuclease UvrABC nuclease subunit